MCVYFEVPSVYPSASSSEFRLHEAVWTGLDLTAGEKETQTHVSPFAVLPQTTAVRRRRIWGSP